jgi:MFS transporter, DHA3 family, macrolide efflux protein
MTEPALSFRDVLRIVVMRRVWYAQVISLFGDFLALFTVISVVSFRMHGTPNQITLVQIAYLLPVALLGPLAGVFVDRWPLKPTLVASDLMRAALAALLIVSTSLWQIYLVLIALSCVSTFFAPAQAVTIRSHVPTTGLLSANALMQMAFMGTRILGPALAGALVAALGPGFCYGVDVVSFLGSAALIASVPIRRAVSALPPSATPGRGSVHALWVDMQQGVRFILGHPSVSFVMIAMAAGLFTVGCFGPLVAVYVREILHATELLFGLVSAMIGAGMIVGTLALRRLASRMSNEKLVLSGLAGIGGGAFLLGAVPLAAASVAATFLIGLAFSAIIVPSQTLIQQETPPAMMGRVQSSSTSILFLAQILGLVLSGGLAGLFGVRLVFIGCAALAALLASAGRLFLHMGRGATPPATASATL